MSFSIKADKYVLENNLLNHLYREEGVWYVTSFGSALETDEPFYSMTVEELLSMCPQIKAYLNHPDGTTLTINHKGGDVFVHPLEELNSTGFPSIASLPGRIKINFFIWARHNVLTTLMNLLSIAMIIIASYIISPFFLPLIVIPFWWTYHKRWRPVAYHLANGDICPGVIVQSKPCHVAFYTNLSTGKGFFPAIKFAQTNIYNHNFKSLPVGTRVLGSALYEAYTDDMRPYWINFNPIPIQRATNDWTLINKLMKNIDPSERNRLESILIALENNGYKLNKFYPLMSKGNSWEKELVNGKLKHYRKDV